jgi:hypothetical protein
VPSSVTRWHRTVSSCAFPITLTERGWVCSAREPEPQLRGQAGPMSDQLSHYDPTSRPDPLFHPA